MLNKVFKTAYETNPALKFEVFIHKIGENLVLKRLLDFYINIWLKSFVVRGTFNDQMQCRWSERRPKV